MSQTPFLATCERCHLKFFTPLGLSDKPIEAEQNLRNRFEIHKCRSNDVGEVATLQHAPYENLRLAVVEEFLSRNSSQKPHSWL